MNERGARSVVGDLTQDYRTTLLRFLPRRDEAARAAAYDVGRRAFTQGVSLLDLCRVHHEVALDVLRETPARPRSHRSTCLPTRPLGVH